MTKDFKNEIVAHLIVSQFLYIIFSEQRKVVNIRLLALQWVPVLVSAFTTLKTAEWTFLKFDDDSFCFPIEQK